MMFRDRATGDRVWPTRPRILLALGASAAIAIWSNALWLQDGKHPAPLFAAHKAAPAAKVPARAAKTDALARRAEPAADHAMPADAGQASTARLQQGLRELGFYDGPVDGIDGPRTRMAVRLYTVAHGLDAGSIGDDGLLAHVRATGGDLAALPPPPPLAGTARRVRAAQTLLRRLGYDPGAVDGVLGTATARAIALFERDRGLPVTGRMSETLMRELTGASGLTVEQALAG